MVEFDQMLQVLLTTSMFVGGFFGFVLDNTVPGALTHQHNLTDNLRAQGVLPRAAQHGMAVGATRPTITVF